MYTSTLPVANRFQNIFSTILEIIVGSMLIALCARIQIPLPFSPVPLTGQTLAVLLLGTTLGSKKGAASVLLYLAEVSAGLPVLAGGAINALALFGPRCGYLIGMPLQAYLAGKVIERNFSYSVTASLLFLSCLIQLIMGCIGLVSFVGFSNVVFMGLLPFIPGEFLKALIVTRYAKNAALS